MSDNMRKCDWPHHIIIILQQVFHTETNEDSWLINAGVHALTLQNIPMISLVKGCE